MGGSPYPAPGERLGGCDHVVSGGLAGDSRRNLVVVLGQGRERLTELALPLNNFADFLAMGALAPLQIADGVSKRLELLADRGGEPPRVLSPVVPALRVIPEGGGDVSGHPLGAVAEALEHPKHLHPERAEHGHGGERPPEDSPDRG